MLMRISEVMKESDLVPNVHCHIDKGLMEMTSAFYTCDRIFTTPIPLMYTRHTARFLLIWLLTVPMALYHEFRKTQTLYVPFIIPLISFFNAIFLFGIEELGVQIEEPFSILPLANICNEIQYAGEDLLSEKNIAWFESSEKQVKEKIEAEKDKTMIQVQLNKDMYPFPKKQSEKVFSPDTITIKASNNAAVGVSVGAVAPIDVQRASDMEKLITRKDADDATSRNVPASSGPRETKTIL
jgi:Bestrophin, RFP-TM, chloride channel